MNRLLDCTEKLRGIISKANLGCFVIVSLLVILVVLFKGSCCGRNSSQNENKQDIRLLFENTEFVTELSRLVIAERTTMEIVESCETRKIQLIPASTANYEIRFKTKYTYYVDGAPERWKIYQHDGVAYVDAPIIRAGEASVDSSSVTGSYQGGYLVFGEKNHLELLKTTVTEIARQRAMERQNISLVRETGRRSLTNFFDRWLSKFGFSTKAVRVKFADEKDF